MPVIYEITVSNLRFKTYVKTTECSPNNDTLKKIILGTTGMDETAMPVLEIINARIINGKTAQKYDKRLTVPARTSDGTQYYRRPGNTEAITIISKSRHINAEQTIYHATVPTEITETRNRTTVEEYFAYVVQDYNRLNPNDKIKHPKWHHIISLPEKFLKNYGVEIQEIETNLILTITDEDTLEPGDVFMDSINWCYVYLGEYDGQPNSGYEQPDHGHMYLFIGDDDRIPIMKMSAADLKAHALEQIHARINAISIDHNGMYKKKPYGFIKKLDHIDLDPVIAEIQTAFGTKRVQNI